MTLCCCDRTDFPAAPLIPSGLSVVPRQIGLFADFRAALLADIRGHPELAAWRAREGDDFGVMMLEWWAYVLDVVAFYNSEIARERLLRTARRRESLSGIIALIGYTPRPPIAAHALLAAIAEPGTPVTVPAGAGFRSDAFDDQPPQVFESDRDMTVAPTLNEWTLAPLRPHSLATPVSEFLIEPGSKGVADGQLLAVEWTPGGSLSATRVAAVAPVSGLDGARYLKLSLTSQVGASGTADLGALRLWTTALRAGLDLSGSATVSGTVLRLDALYPQIRSGDIVVVETSSGTLVASRVTAVSVATVSLGGSGPTVTADSLSAGPGSGSGLAESAIDALDSNSDGAIGVPVTQLTIAEALPSTDRSGTRVHFSAVRAGRAVAPAAPFLSSTDLEPDARLVGPVEPLQIPGSGTVLLRDSRERGAALTGDVEVDAEGAGTLSPASGSLPFSDMRTPVSAHGNVIAVTRGESVEEDLGRASAFTDFQTFTLVKKPLTYLADASHPSGRRSTLRLWVAGVEWREVESLFVAGSDDRVYTVRQTTDGDFVVMFGGLGYGQRPPDGAQVFARYRHGGGAAAPAAGQIRQLARRQPGIRRVFNPLGAYGGCDADGPEDIRRAAPASALAMGRAVSLPDFEAMARDFGAINARAEAGWDARAQRPVVRVTVIIEGDDSGQSAAALQGFLAARAAEGTLIAVYPALPVSQTLKVEYAPDPRLDPAVVADNVIAALADPVTGPIALRNAPIGAPLFRSALLATVKAAPGVLKVERLLVDGTPAPFALESAPGHYRNFLPFRNE
jgi:predicted phage baseplate assembly protein